MKQYSLGSIFLFAVLFVSDPAFMSLNNRTSSLNAYHYQIEPASKLFLEGSSNVVDFTCDCTTELQGGQLEISEANQKYTFQNSILQLPVKSLDCGNRVMNRDMYDALDAEQYSSITVRLLSVHDLAPNAFTVCDEWYELTAKIELTIAGECRSVLMDIQAANLGYQLYHFRGRKAIYLTDFNIDPPRALLGTIRVDNCITINMDLQIRLSGA